MQNIPHPIAITTGEPAGIGPDVSLMLARLALEEGWHDEVVLIGDCPFLQQRAASLGFQIALEAVSLQSLTEGTALLKQADAPNNAANNAANNAPSPPAVRVLHHALAAPCVPGQLNPQNAPYVLQLLDSAIDGCRQGHFAAMVTAPIQKSVICDAGHTGFQGHTEYLADKTGTPHVVMMLASGEFRVALATTHLPLSQVPTAITRNNLEGTLRILHTALRTQFGCANPHIVVAGLNPHAGESGHLGREEIDVIQPVLEHLRGEGFALTGPLPADTLFQPKYLANADAVLAMYHDQGLPVLKYASFGRGINITLGLPIIRTSVDHGTALDLAATGGALPDSLLAAWDHACFMVRHQQIQGHSKP